MHRIVTVALALAVSTLSTRCASAEGSLREQLEGIFDQTLNIKLAGPTGTQHGNHFKADSVVASGQIIRTLSNFISATRQVSLSGVLPPPRYSSSFSPESYIPLPGAARKRSARSPRRPKALAAVF